MLTKAELDQINKNMAQFNDDNHATLQAIVQPLFQLGFNHFAYGRQMHGREYFCVCADRNWMYHYMDHDLERLIFQKDMILPKNSKKFVIWDLEEDNELVNRLRIHNHYHVATVFVRHEDYIESWHFATDAHNVGVNDIYMNHFYLLEQFILYFREKARDIIDVSRHNKKNVFVYKNNLYLDLSAPAESNQFDRFLNAIKMDKFLFSTAQGDAYLSLAEFECVKALSSGLSAKEIAIVRTLSPRTVETYLAAARTKLGVSNKAQLISLFKESIYANFQSNAPSVVQLTSLPEK